MKQLVFVIVAALLITYALFSFIDSARPAGRGMYMGPAAPSVSVSGLSYRKTETSYDSTWYSWKADIRNASTDRVEAFCRLQLLDKDGFEVGSDLSNVNLAPGETRTLTEKDYVASYLWSQVTRASISCDVHGLPQDIVVTNFGTEAIAGASDKNAAAPPPGEALIQQGLYTDPTQKITVSGLSYKKNGESHNGEYVWYTRKFDIGNTSAQQVEASCTLRVLDKDGAEVWSDQISINLAPGETQTMRNEGNVASQLWSQATGVNISCDVR